MMALAEVTQVFGGQLAGNQASDRSWTNSKPCISTKASTINNKSWLPAYWQQFADVWKQFLSTPSTWTVQQSMSSILAMLPAAAAAAQPLDDEALLCAALAANFSSALRSLLLRSLSLCLSLIWRRRMPEVSHGPSGSNFTGRGGRGCL